MYHRSLAAEARRKLGQYEYFREKNVRKFTEKDEHFREAIEKLRKELADYARYGEPE